MSNLNNVKIKVNILNNIISTFENSLFEHGGILGCNAKQEIVAFYYDKGIDSKKNQYIPDVKVLNDIINNNWKTKGIYFCGLIHTHPYGYSTLSMSDKIYFSKILQENPNKKWIYCPVFQSNNSKHKINFYILSLTNAYEILVDEIGYILIE